ncbi:gliding motility protein GldL [Segatella copri]|jgi:gliding motility-associated protein GldL|uniref:type IX secretion system motor protein PorL/GldL n=1 Tax=Segatella copri TaxID=165179 RepID=UPI001932F358|nr:gliding motility protein GldL [Segatella copri]MBM0130344.1 gliding motility protein GldL [Segatella copri]
MGEYSKFNIVYHLQKWMDSVPGQTFLNYAYSWGASIVILGALFKLTHLPGANFMLFAGMGTEAFVFFLSAFDRPFDKTADGRDIPTHVTEEYLETGKVTYGETEEAAASAASGSATVAGSSSAASVSGTPVSGGQTIIIGGGSFSGGAGVSAASSSVAGSEKGEGAEQIDESVAAAVAPGAGFSESGAAVAGATMTGGSVVGGSIAGGNTAWVAGQQGVTPEMADAQNTYVEELKKLVETLEKVNEQSTRLTRDSEEMENLNRTLTGISKVYEMQLKGASQQIGTIDQINEQSRKMAQQIEQLNKIYARMIEAMTVNMRAAAPQVKSEE